MARTNLHREIATQRGFSILELMIALTILLIGITGILTMQIISMRATAYSRHATEAAVLCEDKLEQLRTIPINTVPASSSEKVSAQGVTTGNPEFDFFTRSWNISWNGTLGTLTCLVSWMERGSEPHGISMTTFRQAP